MFSKLHFKVMSCFANLKSKSQTYSIYNLIRHRKSRKSLKNVPGDRNLLENVLYVFVNKIIISALDIHFHPFKSLPEPGKQRKNKHVRRKRQEDKKNRPKLLRNLNQTFKNIIHAKSVCPTYLRAAANPQVPEVTREKPS